MAIHGPSGSTPVLDNFIRPDGGLGANWGTDPSGCGNIHHDIKSNKLRTDQIYTEDFWAASAFAADQEAFVFVDHLEDTQGTGLVLRANSHNGYEIFIRRTGSSYVLTQYSFTPGCLYENLPDTDIPFADNMWFGAACVGQEIRSYTSPDGITWTLRHTATWDKHLGGGNIGLYSENASVPAPIVYTAFGGGDYVESNPLPHHQNQMHFLCQITSFLDCFSKRIKHVCSTLSR